MKKLNNKGFAISTLLYTIMIMVFLVVFALMSTLGTTRKNTKNLSSQIEDELNNYSLTNVTMMYDAGVSNPRKYIVPSSGWYKIELWGSKYENNNGSYTSGIIYLEENNHIYITLGSEASNTSPDSSISLTDDNENIIMLAPGGAAQNAESSKYILAGYAGTEMEINNNLNTTKDFIIEYGEYDADGTPQYSSIRPIFYDGLYVKDTWDNIGKVKIFKISDNTKENLPIERQHTKLDNVRYIKDCVQGNSVEEYTNDAHWVEIQAISNGLNIARFKPRYKYINNTFLNFTDDTENGNHYLVNGSIDAVNGYLGLGGATGPVHDNVDKCVIIDLEETKNLEELAVWHYYKDNRIYRNNTLSVSTDNNTWTDLRKTFYNQNGSSGVYNSGEEETSLGIRHSSFQHHSTNIGDFKDGKYYIFYTGDKERNKVITKDTSSNGINLQLFKAEKKQQWQVTKNNDNTYKITNLEKKCSIQIVDDVISCDNNGNNNWSIGYQENNHYIISIPNSTAPTYGINGNTSNNTLLKGIVFSYSASSRFKFVRINE